MITIFKTRGSDKRSKILIVGSSGVGKTSLRNRYVKGNFRNEEMMTIGIEFDSAEIQINGIPLKMEIYDIAGQEAFKIQKKIVKNVHGVIIVCDLTRQETLFSVRSWVDKIFELSPRLKAPFIVVGNKEDLNQGRQIPAEDVVKMIEIILEEKHVTTKFMTFIETSAKTGFNISEVFETLANEIILQFHN